METEQMMHKQNAHDLVPIRDEYIQKVTVGEIKPHNAPILSLNMTRVGLNYLTMKQIVFVQCLVTEYCKTMQMQRLPTLRKSWTGQMQTNSKSEDKNIPYLR